jgi:hypothetical protein
MAAQPRQPRGGDYRHWVTGRSTAPWWASRTSRGFAGRFPRGDGAGALPRLCGVRHAREQASQPDGGRELATLLDCRTDRGGLCLGDHEHPGRIGAWTKGGKRRSSVGPARKSWRRWSTRRTRRHVGGLDPAAAHLAGTTRTAGAGGSAADRGRPRCRCRPGRDHQRSRDRRADPG